MKFDILQGRAWRDYRFFPLVAAIVTVAAARADAQFSFGPGDYYSANNGSDLITQYSTSGVAVGTLAVPGADSVRGIAFGPDGLLYAATVQGAGFSVFAMNSAGTVEQTYSGSVYLEGGTDLGQVAVNSQYLYVAGQNSLTQFVIGQPNSGTVIYQNNQVYGVSLEANGDLWVASAYQIQNISPSGTVLATVPGDFVDLRGIAYDPAANSLFVTEFGDSGSSFQLLRLDASTGAIEASTSFWYGDDIFLTDSGDLLVASSTQSPGIFNENLEQIGTFSNGSQLFVTEDPVPEPGTGSLLGAAGLLLAVSKTRRKLVLSRGVHGK